MVDSMVDSVVSTRIDSHDCRAARLGLPGSGCATAWEPPTELTRDALAAPPPALRPGCRWEAPRALARATLCCSAAARHGVARPPPGPSAATARCGGGPCGGAGSRSCHARALGEDATLAAAVRLRVGNGRAPHACRRCRPSDALGARALGLQRDGASRWRPLRRNGGHTSRHALAPSAGTGSSKCCCPLSSRRLRPRRSQARPDLAAARSRIPNCGPALERRLSPLGPLGCPRGPPRRAQAAARRGGRGSRGASHRSRRRQAGQGA